MIGRLPSIRLLCCLAGCASIAHGQRQKNPPLEFTRQGLLIMNFSPGAGADLRLARRAGDAVRDRVAKLVNKREVEVIEGDTDAVPHGTGTFGSRSIKYGCL